ncbi:enoyl-CoA hydratase-related protein [Bradyrhizobium sp. AS23.2]|uniref:enoyl-CoA hydratase/isomerase family protein n=1 Tax=Bradyrhizobium sp. AS23.2 TaxID=1680155 RepID=UPI00093DD92F|nr:enoyl-CoA hydratase-related protein [Bradyrhizobium sp. AS23.2]OKO81097.1 enoyl-CoA hydratase [Bradyrhizobium sp. AS23.2]
MLTQEVNGETLVLTLNHPAKRNPLTQEIRAGLLAGMTRAEKDPAIRAVVITGAGGNFCSGGDIESMKEVTDLAAGRERFRETHQLARLMVGGSKPSIAAVEGWAAGAGIALALCCDVVIATETARFMASFGRIGLIADFGLLATLPARVGQGRARNMLMTGEPVGAVEAERIGLADAVVPEGKALEAALAKAAVIARNAPLSIAYTKVAFAANFEALLSWEREAQSTLLLTQDHAEGRAAFAEKRPPVFQGR